MSDEVDYVSLAKQAIDSANEVNKYEAMKAKGSGGAGRGFINPPMPGEPPAMAKKSNVVDVANKAKELAENSNLLPSEEFMLDPRNWGALAGSSANLLSHYRNRNNPSAQPAKQSSMSSSAPANVEIDPATGKPFEIWDESAGSRALTSNQGLNKGVAQAENLAQQNLTHFLELNPDYRVTPGLLNPAGEMGPSVFENGIFRPLSVQRQIANEAVNAPRVSATVPTQPALSTGEKLLKAFPNAPKVAAAVKGALPIVGSTVNAAGAGYNIGDVIGRLVDKDYTGAGISGVGGTLAMLADAPVGIPVGLTTALIQYYHDHPELLGGVTSNLGKMVSGNKPAPTASQFQANPMADY
jgi:hypothetical protein